ncbi:MAG: tRNA (guanosine(37)-N1)-methyltransferase TrmD [Candidatus Gastranaerophilales bacterium]|nr:tRNA (guanosine(37)-N1)-methyltransferase TrmD [Candidatus Gastranaerophilales bacterium]
MRFDVITLFPELIETYCSSSIIGRAQKQDLIAVNPINPRDFTSDKHRTVDDTPYGGGAGMVLMCDPIFQAVESVERQENSELIMLTPQGEIYNHETAKELSKKDQLILICGHYEGFDERIREGLKPREISIGDYVLTGGELGALAIIDSVTRLLPGTLGKDESAIHDSFFSGLLEHPHYTRPPEYREMKVPDVLLSGNHKEIDKYRRKQSIKRTYERRSDLFKIFEKSGLSKEDKIILKELGYLQEK